MWIKQFAFNTFILTALYLGQSTVFAAAEPVSIECPCSLERTFPTTWSLKFSIVFDREIDQAGGLEISSCAEVEANGLVSGPQTT